MPLTVSAVPDVPDGVEVLGVPVAAGPTVLSDGHGVEPGHLEDRGFEAKVGETVVLPGRGDATVVAVGVGPAAEVNPDVLRRAAGALVRAAWKRRSLATPMLDAVPGGGDRAAAAQAAAEGAALAAYRFTRYKSDPDPCRLDGVALVASDAGALEGPLRQAAAVTQAVYLARDLVNEPAGSLSPSELAQRARGMAEGAGLGVEVLDEVAASEMGLGGLLGVARGSDEPPRLIKLTYDPPDPRATVALVGKGITFDSGGLSIKTAEGMMTMKNDMSGGAAVIAAMSALPALAPPVKVLAFVPATENMPGGRATKPGDVLRTRNGTTVEVLNTDAEGRLVLADGLALAVEEEPDAIVDLATLTGACITALGDKIMGLMGNDDDLIDQVRSASERAGEPAWPLPLPKEYRKQLDSEVADLKNIGGRTAGALTAGLFLQEFVAGVPWVHLDIAGPARAEEDDGPQPKGGTGVGVRTVIELLAGAERFRAPGDGENKNP